MLPRLGKQFPTPRRRRCVSSNRYRFFSPKDRVTIPPKWQKNSGQQTFLLAPECPSVPAYHHQATRGPEPQASLDKFHQNEQIVHFAVSRRTRSRIATIWAGTPQKHCQLLSVFTCQHTLSLACSPLYHHGSSRKVSRQSRVTTYRECQWALPHVHPTRPVLNFNHDSSGRRHCKRV